MNTHGPDVILNNLKEQAQRKASLRMFYAAADLLRDYKGPYAQETAADREKLASEYHAMGKAAEEARWGGGTGVVPTPPPPPRPAPPPKPRPPVTRPATTPAVRARTPKPPEYQLEGNKLTFPCRWCKEPVTADVSQGGKLIPCPKCDLLCSVPKVQS